MAQGVQQYLGATSPTNIPYVEGSGDSAAALGQALEGAAAVGVELYKQKVVGDLSDAVNGVPEDAAASEDNVSRMRDLAAKMSAAKTVPEAEALRKEMEKYAALERQGAMTGGIVAAQNLVKNAIQRNPQFAAEFIEVYKSRFDPGFGGSGGGGSGGSGGSKTYGASGVPDPYAGVDDVIKEANRAGVPPARIRQMYNEKLQLEESKARFEMEVERFRVVGEETLNNLANVTAQQVYAAGINGLKEVYDSGQTLNAEQMSAFLLSTMENGWQGYVQFVDSRVGTSNKAGTLEQEVGGLVRLPDGWMEKQRKKFTDSVEGLRAQLDKFHNPKEVLDALKLRREMGLAELFEGNAILQSLAVVDPRGMAELLINKVPKIIRQATSEKAGMRPAIESMARKGDLDATVALAYLDWINKDPRTAVNLVATTATSGIIDRTNNPHANAVSAIVAGQASMDPSVSDPEKRDNLHRGAQSGLSATLLDRAQNPKATPIPMPSQLNGKWHKDPNVANLLRTDMEFRKKAEDNNELYLRLKFGELDPSRQKHMAEAIEVDYGAFHPFRPAKGAINTQSNATGKQTTEFFLPISNLALRLNYAYEQFSSYAKTPEERKAYIDKLSSIYMTPGLPPQQEAPAQPAVRVYDPDSDTIK